MKYFIVLPSLYFIFIIGEFVATEINCGLKNNTDCYLGTLQIIRKYGYPAESHIVETADGYLLQMHRIPHKKKSKMKKTEYSNDKKIPVFIQHGLLGSSTNFFLIGSESALPFLLADLGYDIWLGNVRGNAYSRSHVTLFPHENKFWNFTWHESAIYDIPAQIDFICNYTEQEKVIYVGFSMGTTMLFALTSILPEYNNKIEVSLLLAPVAYVQNIKSPLIRFFTPFSETITRITDLIANGEFLPNSELLRFFGKIFCELTNTEKRLCTNAIFLVVGKDPKEFDKNLLPILINHFPAGYSIKAINHYSQLVKSGKFRQYDYGEKGNELEYGSQTPPDYDLDLITVPMYFYVGRNDFLANLKDVKHLANQLKTLKKSHLVDYSNFNHLDFLISLDVKKLVYDELIEDLTSHLNDNNQIP